MPAIAVANAMLDLTQWTQRIGTRLSMRDFAGPFMFAKTTRLSPGAIALLCRWL
jgi:hypothetical protein